MGPVKDDLWLDAKIMVLVRMVGTLQYKQFYGLNSNMSLPLQLHRAS